MIIISTAIAVICLAFVYSALITTQAWHVSQEIANDNGLVFDVNGSALLCDSLAEPTATQATDTNKPNHPVQQIAFNATDQRSIDSNNNGWPDIGINITGTKSVTQAQKGFVYHLISEIKR